MLHLYSVVFLILFLSNHLSFAQDKKLEREERIKELEMPEKALGSLKDFKTEFSKLKFYRESDGERSSYETKFGHGKKKYSVEFDEEGKLEDVEVDFDFKEVPQLAQRKISDWLKDFDNYKILKTQKQFSSLTMPDIQVIKLALEDQPTDVVRFELVIEGKASKDWKSYEVLFDSNGNYISKREVVRRAMNNVLY